MTAMVPRASVVIDGLGSTATLAAIMVDGIGSYRTQGGSAYILANAAHAGTHFTTLTLTAVPHGFGGTHCQQGTFRQMTFVVMGLIIMFANFFAHIHHAVVAAIVPVPFPFPISVSSTATNL
jgi:hypothetical protein